MKREREREADRHARMGLRGRLGSSGHLAQTVPLVWSHEQWDLASAWHMRLGLPCQPLDRLGLQGSHRFREAARCDSLSSRATGPGRAACSCCVSRSTGSRAHTHFFQYIFFEKIFYIFLSENEFTFETHCETDEYFHASINAEMLTIAVRTHADCAERWCQFVQL